MSNEEEQKCQLCGRNAPSVYVDSIEEIRFDGNTFQACEACRNYLSTPYTIGEKENK